MHTETWNCFPLSLIGDKRPPPFAALVCVRLSVRLAPSRPALSASICSLHRSSNNSPAQVNPSCALHNCKLGRKILRRRRLVVIRCCEQPSSCTQPTCTAGWRSPRPVCFGPTSAQQHCIAASPHRIASHPHRLSICLSACLPIYLIIPSLLVAPASSSLSLVFETNPRLAPSCLFGLPVSQSISLLSLNQDHPDAP